MFSLESSIKQFSARKYQVWRPPGAKYNKKLITPTVKHPPSQMIWGSCQQRVKLAFIFCPLEAQLLALNT